MSKYQEMKLKLERMQQEAEALRQEESKTAIADIHAKMREFELTPEDLGFRAGAASKKKAKTPGVIKYKHPDGSTWTGKGKPPAWIVEVGDKRDQYLVKPADAAATTKPTAGVSTLHAPNKEAKAAEAAKK